MFSNCGAPGACENYFNYLQWSSSSERLDHPDIGYILNGSLLPPPNMDMGLTFTLVRLGDRLGTEEAKASRCEPLSCFPGALTLPMGTDMA